MKRSILLYLLGVTVLIGCNRRISCSPPLIRPLFVGFKASDLDTLIVREYDRGSNFGTLTDTAIFISDSLRLRYISSNDTILLNFGPISGNKQYLTADHDWQLYIPAQNITVLFSNFDSPQTHQQCFILSDICSCYNPLVSFEQNGLRKAPITDSIKNQFYGNLAVIHR